MAKVRATKNQKELKLDNWNVGYDDHRLDQHNPRELVFAHEWQKENSMWAIVNELIPDATRRDHKVAATIIQWLGTNVGMGFLQKVVDNAVTTDHAFRRIRDSLWR